VSPRAALDAVVKRKPPSNKIEAIHKCNKFNSVGVEGGRSGSQRARG
jgi:hypothetical protein